MINGQDSLKKKKAWESWDQQDRENNEATHKINREVQEYNFQ